MSEHEKAPPRANLDGANPSKVAGPCGQLDNTTDPAIASRAFDASHGRQASVMVGTEALPHQDSLFEWPLHWTKSGSVCVRTYIDEVPFNLPCLLGCDQLAANVCMRDFKTLDVKSFPTVPINDNEPPCL